MSTAEERALARLAASPGAVLARERAGAGYGVYANGDRRRRPSVRLNALAVRDLKAAGALQEMREGDAYVLSEAGRRRVRRENAAPSEAYLAQHAPIVDRAVIDGGGAIQRVRGAEPNAVLRRLGLLRAADGAPWLNASEIAAARDLRGAWERAQIGLTGGSDWSAPPRGAAPRGRASAQEAALAARCDASKRVETALHALAPTLRRVVERVVLAEEGLEAIERAEGWPARSGKIALKLGLAQLAKALA